ncbi:hypothetical protein LCGC14_1703260, partial [marine sediment metagenome]
MLFKVLNTDGSAIHGKGKWNLPKNGTPGEWMPPIEGKLIACERGYHLCSANNLIVWLGPAIYIVKARGDILTSKDKLVVREARLIRRLNAWTEKSARLFACECAEHVLPIFETERPDDKRPRKAIAVTRRYVHGKATKNEMTAAAGAAWAAAGAAWAAAGAAWAAAWAARAAAWAAGDAAWAAGDARAAGDAAWAAAWAARAAAWAAGDARAAGAARAAGDA